jgi:hypothetical protein
MDLRRIVRVEALFEQSEPRRGTGFRVGPRQVLTAQHVVERRHDGGRVEPAREIRVLLDPDGGGKVLRESAKVVWKGESELDPDDHKALDAALLEDELPADDVEPFRDWVRVPLGKSGEWETSGFVSASPDVEEMGTDYLWGVCHPARELATYVKLTVKRGAPVGEGGTALTWAGISGAPVFVKEGRHAGRLYGVVRSSPKRFPDVLHAVGTPALLRNAELRRRLGFKEPAPPHVTLVEKLRALLEEDQRLAEHLAGLEGTWESRWREGGVDDLVDVLCADGTLRTSLEHVRRLFRDASPTSATARRIQEMAVVLATIMASRELPGGEELTADSARRILRLETASPNFAEALLASAYGTPCRYEKADGPDLPRAFLRVPTAATMEAGIRAKSQVEEQLEELVLTVIEKELDRPRFILPAQKALFSSQPPGKRRELLQKTLEKSLTRLRERHGRPAYLVAEGELQKRMGAHLDVFLNRLANVLPSLHLVVLETETEKVAQAIDQEDALWPLWEVLDLLPEE